ncbi:MAG: DUF3095 domain-containing protein [Leptolyngbyaceae bacterium]|nr:DUF3095 domain-containing protein [Leptolyngbyaceae bacterium]
MKFKTGSAKPVKHYKMSTENFYSNLPALEKFLDITDSSNYVLVPEDWQIIITDIKGSTQAIESGRYKNVNSLGACSIVAILNIARNIEIPFIFGGDGASILIPPQMINEAKQALLGIQDLARQGFDMELRVGIVPVSVVTPRHELKIAKLRVSENYDQAIFKGGGLTYATDLVKDVATAGLYAPVMDNLIPNADFSGLECRWQDIPSRHGEIVTLLVLATAPSDSQSNKIYREVITQIQRIYGSEHNFHPVVKSNLNLSFNSQKLATETTIFTQSKGWIYQKFYLLKIKIEIFLGWFFMKFKVKIGEMDWGLYKKIVVESTDHKKFDDLLRMVISGHPSQRKKLVSYLDKKFEEGRLVYGCHISDRALMTCLIFERHGRQVHFIDGADGGYAIAAKAMKEQMRR